MTDTGRPLPTIARAQDGTALAYQHARRGRLVASNEHDAWDVLPHISAPTLILHGDQDRLTPPDNLPLLAGRIPDARAHVFPGARHAYFEECRSEASTLVRAFLS